MFRKISSAVSDAHSFSSLASPFTRQPKPTLLISRNSRSLFTYAENSPRARLLKFFKTNCKSGNVSAEEARRCFHRMVRMQPKFSLYSFNLLLNGLARNKRYSDVVSLYGDLKLTGLIPNLVTLNILLSCSSNASKVIDAFLVRILRKGYSPSIVTLCSPVEDACIGSRIECAALSFERSEKFGYPGGDTITFNTLLRGLCRSRNTNNALKLDEEMVNEISQCGVRCKYVSCINDSLCKGSLCKVGKEDNSVQLLSSPDFDAEIEGFNPYVPSAWVVLFCNTVVHRVLNKFKGDELKLNIHSKEKGPIRLAWLTTHDPANLKELEDFVSNVMMSLPS